MAIHQKASQERDVETELSGNIRVCRINVPGLAPGNGLPLHIAATLRAASRRPLSTWSLPHCSRQGEHIIYRLGLKGISAPA